MCCGEIDASPCGLGDVTLRVEGKEREGEERRGEERRGEGRGGEEKRREGRGEGRRGGEAHVIAPTCIVVSTT